jgi:predicted O-linked N-acetylglucosamine transferase (SPINDLY family)
LGLFDRFSKDPKAPDPLALIAEGNAAEDEGRLADALKLYDQAITVAPELGRAHLNRGNALMSLRDFDGAIKAFETAFLRDPTLAGAQFNLGNALARQRRFEEASSAYRKALELKPGFVDADVALGSALDELGKLDDAVFHYRRALQSQPGVAPVYGNLGAVLIKQRQFAEAAVAFRRALELDPGQTHLHYGLGTAYWRLGHMDAALNAFQSMVKSHPDHGVSHVMLGLLFQNNGRLLESVESYRRAIELTPDDVVTHNNLGGLYRQLGQLDEAAASWRRALEISPDLHAAHSNLIFLDTSRASGPTAALIEQARSFGVAAARNAKIPEDWANSPDPDRLLRIGFVSGDLCAHPVGYFLLAFLTSLNKQAVGRLESYAYFSNATEDGISARIRAQCHGWRQVHSLDDEALVRLIRDDGIDILIDLSGHTGENRLPAFALKPAPVQATWLGYLGTTGVAAVDYLIADEWTLPPDLEPQFTEKIWRLPRSYLCFTPPTEDGAIGPLPALSNGYVTFGSFNNLGKVGPDVVSLWARVLDAVPRSRLLLKTMQFVEPGVRENVAQQFARHGISGSRLVLEPPVARPDYLKPFNRVDIALDPFPYPGITTSVVCLWMGVTFITLAGKTFMARQGVGLLNNAGLADWVATDVDDYVKMAVRRAGDLQSLQQIRQELRARVLASPIFDAPSFAHDFENAMRGMWHVWCKQR